MVDVSPDNVHGRLGLLHIPPILSLLREVRKQ
jgi:hypothetical protein